MKVKPEKQELCCLSLPEPVSRDKDWVFMGLNRFNTSFHTDLFIRPRKGRWGNGEKANWKAVGGGGRFSLYFFICWSTTQIPSPLLADPWGTKVELLVDAFQFLKLQLSTCINHWSLLTKARIFNSWLPLYKENFFKKKVSCFACLHKRGEKSLNS